MQQYPFAVSILRSSRKTAAIQIANEHTVIVRVPQRMPQAAIYGFIDLHRGWIDSHLAAARERAEAAQPTLTPEQVQTLARQAGKCLAQKAAYFAPLVGVDYGRITVRCQRTRWGSCSALGNLNFNCLLMLCPEPVIDYVVVHELCHRLELNHSPRFWAQVAWVLPDYEAPRRWLRENGRLLMDRLPDKNV